MVTLRSCWFARFGRGRGWRAAECPFAGPARLAPHCGGPGWATLAGGLDERQGCFGDVLPAAVEDQGVAAVRDLLDLGGGAVAFLLSVGGGGDGMGGDVVFLACDEQHGAAGVLGVHLDLGERVDVGCRGLEGRDPRSPDADRPHTAAGPRSR